MEYPHGGDIYTYENMLDFSVNVNPFGPGEAVLEAVRRAVPDIINYPDSQCRRLAKALAEKEHIRREQLIFGNGAAELLFPFIQAVRPKKAVLPVPAFAEYERALESVGCEICCVPLKREENFDVTETLLESLREDVDVLFLCSPSNPAGRVLKEDLLEKIAGRCEKLHIRLVLDECFREFTDRRGQNFLTEKLEEYPMVFLLRAFTKTFAIPGLRLGYGISSDMELLFNMRKFMQPWNVSVLAQAAGEAALGAKADSQIAAMRDDVAKERDWMEEQLTGLGIRYIASEANFILFYSPLDMFSLLLKEGILIRDCKNYRGLEKGYYRVAVKRHKENKKLMDAMRKILTS